MDEKTTGIASSNIIFDESGNIGIGVGQVSSGLTFTTTTNNSPNTNWNIAHKHFIDPIAPEGIGALGETHVSEDGFKWVYSTEGWLQVNRVSGPGLWDQIDGKEEEIIKGTKKKLKCF
jgi:hypothetical protein